jgi:hypothetical protein
MRKSSAMPKQPKIVGGIWSMNVGSSSTWHSNGWRSDFPESLMEGHPDLRIARYQKSNGEAVEIPIDQLRAALSDAPTREEKKRRGPFNIHPLRKTIEFAGHIHSLPGLLYFAASKLPDKASAELK